ncbi:MAG TPA: hypothetical protein VFK57_14540 [Vicinamibacterales bacterium]|nr:hypothetical protein [Vicinamibacterales bacterium]
MRSIRNRRTLAAFCIALVVFSAFLPAGLSDTVWAALIPLGFVVSLIGATTIARAASRCDEQTVALLSLVLLRAPPAC